MADISASRFPALAAPERAPLGPRYGLGLTLSLLPLPLGEIAILLAAWMLILPI